MSHWKAKRKNHCLEEERKMYNVLLVVDYQKDFVDGALGFESAKNLDDGICELVKQYIEDENGLVICTFDTHNEKYLEMQEGINLPVPHCVYGSEGWKLYGKTGEYINSLYDGHDVIVGDSWLECLEEISSMEDDSISEKLFLVNKPTFPSLILSEFLRRLDVMGIIDTITIVGVVTNMCVIGNAVMAKAACPEAKIIIKKDLVDSFDKELHQKALDVMESMQMIVE